MQELVARFDLAVTLVALIAAARLLLPIIQGMVEYSKKLGASGKICVIEAGVFGAGIGVFAFLALYGTPTELWHWFVLVLMGLILGLAASGDYDLEKNLRGEIVESTAIQSIEATSETVNRQTSSP